MNGFLDPLHLGLELDSGSMALLALLLGLAAVVYILLGPYGVMGIINAVRHYF